MHASGLPPIFDEACALTTERHLHHCRADFQSVFNDVEQLKQKRHESLKKRKAEVQEMCLRQDLEVFGEKRGNVGTCYCLNACFYLHIFYIGKIQKAGLVVQTRPQKTVEAITKGCKLIGKINVENMTITILMIKGS